MARSSRRRFLAASATTMGLTAGCATLRDLTGPPASIDTVDGTWPVFGYDRGNTNVAPDHRGPTSDLARAWKTDVDKWVKFTPIVADDTVLAVTIRDTLYALDATSGQRQWQHRGTGVAPPPTASDGTVYVGESDRVAALDIANGEERWAVEVGEHVAGAPVVTGDAVYASGGDGTVFALDPDDGTRAWSTETSGHTGQPAVANGSVFHSDEETVYALSTESGSIRWKRSLPSMEHARLSVADGLLVVGQRAEGEDNTGKLYALDAKSGAQRWKRPVNEVFSGVAVGRESLYVVGGSYTDNDNRDVVRRLARSDGTPVWSKRLQDGLIAKVPVVAGDSLYVNAVSTQNDTSRILALDLASGATRWTLEVDAPLTGLNNPVVVDGVVFVGDSEGYVHAYADPR